MTQATDPEIGIPEIDQQHAAIFRQQSVVCDLLEQNADRTAINDALDTLEQMMQSHLAFEVALMETHGYSDQAGHEKRHASLVAGFAELMDKIRREGASPFNHAAFRMDIADAFVEHVRNCDMKMATDLRKE